MLDSRAERSCITRITRIARAIGAGRVAASTRCSSCCSATTIVAATPVGPGATARDMDR